MQNTLYKAFVVEELDGEFVRKIQTLSTENLPVGAVLVRVHYSSVNYKDALSATGNKGVTKKYPHTPGIDAAGIVEWNRRLQFLQKWFSTHFDDENYTADELRDFRKQTGVTHILTDRIGPLELDPVFENETYDIYDLTTLD